MTNKLVLAICFSLIFIFSLTTIWSTTPKLFLPQFAFLVTGLLLVLVFAKTDIGLWFNFSPIFYFLSIILLLVTLIFGETVRGSTRWISLGPASPQTSEFVKPLLTLFFAHYLSKRNINHLKTFISYLILALLPAGLILIQPDLGSALVILALSGSIALFSGFKLKNLILIVIFLALLSPLAIKTLKPYQIDRLQSFIDPYHDPLGSGYNVIQSVIAIGSGGLFGRGVRLGTQSHLNYLPERHTDFIFASFAEEFGFVGMSLLLGSYVIIFSSLIKILYLLNDNRAFLFQVGLISIFVFQTFVNLGMNLGLAPVTGITLPLFSYGGSSLLSFSILLGLNINLLEFIPRMRI
ncbi:rod shape-determining protein RodA [Candidatus Collierbacteria bacterium]|nr:rod shape-determining protein RodA [Candidatus Collierbacteria bacterium]